MKQEFILIGDSRYRKNTVKKYEPFQQSGTCGIYIYFSTSRTKPDRVYHNFGSKRERDLKLTELDQIFGII